MQKTKVMCLILALVLATAGTAGVLVDLSDNSEPPIIPDNAQNTIMDKPSEGTPSDRSAIENLYIAQGELQRKGGFVGQTRGTTTSAGISQTVVNNRTVINGNVFKEMITVGAVKNAYQLYLHGDNYLYRGFKSIKSADSINWADAAQKYSYDDFMLTFGHRSDSLTGYILNDETIVEGNLEKEEGGLYTFRYILNIDTAPARMLYEMKANSNMNGFSTFTKAEIVVTMDADWQVKTLTTDCKYKVPMFGGLACTEDITETFSDLTGGDLPETEFFEQFFDAEVTVPVDKEPDALSILMDMFSPYIEGSNLNVALKAEMDGQPVLNGLVSAKIDIENIANIEVAAKISDELFIEYQQGKLFVTYQDFKASTTVDGIMGVVNALMPQTVDGFDFNADDLLDKFTYKAADGKCVVNLPLNLGEEEADINIYADVTDGKYIFTHAEVSVGSLKLYAEPTGAFEMPAHSGDYPEILGLLDLIQNGVIYGKINVFEQDLDVTFDLSSMSLRAKGDNLCVNYENDTIFAEYGAIKVKLGLDNLDNILTLLRVSGILDKIEMPQMPELSISKLFGMLSEVTATSTDNGTVFALSMDDIGFALYLTVTANGWSVEKVTLNLYGNAITLAPSAPFADNDGEINDNDYADVAEMLNTFVNPIACLLTANSYGANFDFVIDADGVKYVVNGDFAYDSAKNISVKATVSNGVATLVNATVTVVDGIVYLELNGIKAAFALNEMSGDIDLPKIVGEIYGANEQLDGIIDAIGGFVAAVKNIDIASIDFANVVKAFGFSNGSIALVVDAGFIGLNDISLHLSAQGNNLVASIDGLELSDVKIGAQATVRSYAAKINAPNASDYVLNLKGTVNNGIDFIVSADLLNMDISAQVNAFNQTVLLRYFNGKAYAKIGEVAISAKVDELAEFIAEIMSELGMESTSVDMSSFANIDWSFQSILSALTLDLNGALSFGLQIDNFANVRVDFNNDAELVNITANVGDWNIVVEQTTETVPQIDIELDYVDIADLAKNFINQIKSIIGADGYAVTLNGTFNFDGSIYGVRANIEYNNGLHVDASITYCNNALVNLQLWYVDSVIYAQLGELKFAMNVGANGNAPSLKESFDLSNLKGYNAHVDSIVDLIANAIDKFSSNSVDFASLVSGLTYKDGILSAAINGTQLGLSDFTLNVANNNGIVVSVDGFAADGISADFNACIAVSNASVFAPKGDFSTNLAIKVDDVNTIYANIDLLNGVYNFRLDDMYLMYADNVIKFKKGDLYLTGDIDAIMDYVTKIDDLVNAFSGAAQSTIAKFDFDSLKNIDLKTIVNSLAINLVGEGVSVSASAFGLDINIMFVGGAINYIDVDVNALGAKLTIYASENRDYFNFDDDANYIAIEQILADYMPIIEKLVNTNGWKFSFDGDTMLSFGSDNYKIAAGSSFEFYYKNTEGMDTFKLRAKLDVYKFQGNNTWQEFMSLDIVYKDGNIYVSDTGRKVGNNNRNTIKLTISVDTIKKCGSLYDQLVEVIPQIGELVDKMMSAMAEAEKNAESIPYATILSEISYNDDKVFGLALNGTALLSKLGVVTLSAQAYGDSLSLNDLELHYDSISVKVCNLRVSAYDLAVDDINAYDITGHMDFNSLYELLSAFVATATPADESGVRSFYIDGTATMALKIIGINLADIEIGLAVKVDITEDNKVYISAKITRTKPSGIGSAFVDVYNDNGGDSYLYFDGSNETFTVIRNSYTDKYTETVYEVVRKYCSECGGSVGPNKNCLTHIISHGKKYYTEEWDWVEKEKKYDDGVQYRERNYAADNITAEDFTANIMDYIFELFNFGSTIKDPIVKAIKEPSSSDFGIEDILKDYSYSETQSVFAVKTDLSAIDSNLGALNVEIYHNVNYSLSNLNVNVELLGGMCKAKVPFELKESTYGEATQIVNETIYW